MFYFCALSFECREQAFHEQGFFKVSVWHGVSFQFSRVLLCDARMLLAPVT
jgi:hypothetical protein